ncbi:DUF1080 domain-containing protein [Gemmatimonadota bacterium]
MKGFMRSGGGALTALMVVVFLIAGGQAQQESVHAWKIHDPDRPLPPVVEPGPSTGEDESVPAPSDAMVLFNGTDLSHWQSSRGGPAQWKVENGYMEITGRGGAIRTSDLFGDCQLHVEYRLPDPPSGEGQNRGNSGIFLQDIYEVQILDSYGNITYADGMMGALYGQYPPLVNVCRPPGEWQSLDILYTRPRFNSEGGLLEPAIFTVFHNGVLIHDHAELVGPTVWQQRPPYEAHADRLPISIQDHGAPVRFRNIWIRDLER